MGRGLLGLSYELLDQSAAGRPQIMLTRRDDVQPDQGTWDSGHRNLSFHYLDQVLMALVFTPPGFCVTLRADYDPDYHVPAMIKVLRLVGHTVVDVVDGAQRIITLGSRP